ncbi:MAG: peptidoglycan DD-metalloendopeptidase family protein [Congregibacter sp.]|nr:peptidoglycan DD-metalloendopeptidase family protein [Congregibacter sp.]
MTRSAAPLFFACICVLLTACADKPMAPIEDRNQAGTSRVEQRYTVLRGDTLFSIAFRYGLDFRRLAAANAIAAPYTIYPGQKLRLAEANAAVVAARSSDMPKAAGTSAQPSVQPTEKTVARPTQVVPTPRTAVARSAASATAPAASGAITQTQPKPLAYPAPVIVAPPAPPAPQATAAKPAAVAAEANVPVGSWRWPATGRVTRSFETNLHKGLDISGERGDPVLASAGGRVVYAGSGIAGYGLMLIVRHNEEYLSAYGHNDALLVDEGDDVSAGQKIAERGSSGTDTVKLHFEIRRRGRPVDPLQILPKR